MRFIKAFKNSGSRLLMTATKASSSTETVEFQHPDRLGTKLMTNAATGTTLEQSTLPFGTPIPAESSGYSNQVFTSYDRSPSTGLDYAVNRTYSSGQSRFTQVDPIGMASANIGDPQSLNLYSYTQNAPTDFVDPSGLDEQPAGGGEQSGILWTVYFGNNQDGWRAMFSWFEAYASNWTGSNGGHSGEPAHGAMSCSQALKQAGRSEDGLIRDLNALNSIFAKVGDLSFARLLAAICIQETDFLNINQFGGGPGRGVYQIEPNTYGVSEAVANDPALAANAIARELGKYWGNELNALESAGYEIGTSNVQYWALAGLARIHNRGAGGVVSVNKRGIASLGSLLQSGLNSGNIGDLDNANGRINKNLKETAHGTYVRNVMDIFFSCLNG